ncbi:GNAT family N-acetyltransferase|uniref:Acetyltransferase (GNAT) domain-containing protein n=1 Tax=Dendrosporobacter quercicolus TaxID=146817 RepID=A0A1H0ALJ2_9FIRM|nr:GNAT family N-acetyltransferase [Dendrosporobacter quercicolus]NSL49544.1 GNAT family N-acetyltransferase [Dendrosporobacter quercicolus DSM 1736]SDN34400.1 Acetyltransferase (GNAT) domain-containing protein [Dendrosporobacter quercicolus]
MLHKANLSEIDEIIELKLSMFRESGHMDLLADDAKQRIRQKYIQLYQNDEAAHFLIKDSGKIIACCGGFIKSDIPYSFYKQSYYGFIGDVYTIPQERTRGLATDLTKATIAWLKSKGVWTIRLLASEQGKPIYQKMGFVNTDEMALALE